MALVKHYRDNGVTSRQKKKQARTNKKFLKDPAVIPPVDGYAVQPPPGLDLARQNDLFTKIRPFCADEAKDITCPQPKTHPTPVKIVDLLF